MSDVSSSTASKPAAADFWTLNVESGEVHEVIGPCGKVGSCHSRNVKQVLQALQQNVTANAYTFERVGFNFFKLLINGEYVMLCTFREIENIQQYLLQHRQQQLRLPQS
jgi:hypothetical protein